MIEPEAGLKEKLGQNGLLERSIEEIRPLLDEKGMKSFLRVVELFSLFDAPSAVWLLRSGASVLSAMESEAVRRSAMEVILGMGKSNWSVGVAGLKTLVDVSKTDSGFKLDWLERGSELAKIDQDVAVAYFNASPPVLQHLGGPKFSEWASLGRDIAEKSWRAAKEYYKASPEAVTKIEPGDIEQWVRLGLYLIEKSPKIKAKHKAQSLLAQGAGAGRATKLHLGVQYFKSAPQILSRLSMHDIEEWVLKGLDVTGKHKERGTAFFSLQTGGSRQAVEGLVKGLELTDVHTVLRSYAEALTGSKIFLRSSSLFYKNLPGLARFFSVTDGENIFLPSQISVFKDQDLNFTVYKLALTHEMAHMQFGTFGVKAADMEGLKDLCEPALSFKIFEFLEDERVDYLMDGQYPGLVKDRRKLVKTYLAQRENHELSVFESLCFGLPHHSGAQEASYDFLGKLLEEALSKIKTPHATARTTLEVTYWLAQAFEDSAEAAADKNRKTPERPFYRGVIDFELVEDARKGRADLLAAAMTRLSKQYPEITLELLKKAIDRIEESEGIEPEELLWQIEDKEKKNDLYEQIELTIEEMETEKRIRQTVYYDEWNHEMDDYNKVWCKVREMDMPATSIAFYNETVEKNYGVVSQLRRHFSMLRPDRIQRFFREERGDDIDYSALIEAVVERHAGVTPSDRVYIRREKNLRDVSVAFLADMSYSTSDVLPSGKRIIDVEKESLVLMAEALESIGDQWAVYGFSTKRKEKVDFYVVRDFGMPFNDEVKMRFQAMAPMAQTRLGAVIRHASSILAKQPSRIRILILLSDGRPYDIDYGDAAHALEDTRKALLEGRRKGLTFFCITVDKKSREYLPYMYGEANFTVINNVDALPIMLPLIYKRLTT